MIKLRDMASGCTTKADYVTFLKNCLPIDIEDSNNGIIMHLNKQKCTCINSSCIEKCGVNLCDCTKAHEEYAWSLFFGKPIKVEIIESILRGGNDCVINFIFKT